MKSTADFDDASADAQDSLLSPGLAASKPIENRKAYGYLGTCLIITFILVALVASIGLLPLMDNKKQSPEGASPFADCGTDRETALSRGCVFDVMSFSWLLPECYDGALVEDFLAERDWQWFMDEEGQVSVPLHEVRLGDVDELLVTFEYHLFHCTYMWKKLHRAVLHTKPIDSYIADYNHTTHCEEMLMMERTDLQALNTNIGVKFTACGI